MEGWSHAGDTAFSSEKNPKTGVIVKFHSQVEEGVRVSLKSLGLKWNSLRKEWEWYTILQELNLLLREHETEIREIQNAS